MYTAIVMYQLFLQVIMNLTICSFEFYFISRKNVFQTIPFHKTLWKLQITVISIVGAGLHSGHAVVGPDNDRFDSWHSAKNIIYNSCNYSSRPPRCLPIASSLVISLTKIHSTGCVKSAYVSS